MNELVMTRGNDRTFDLIVDDDYDGDAFRFTVDGLFTKTGTVGSDDGSGHATASVTIAEEDTEDVGFPWYGSHRRFFRWELEVTHSSDILTIRRGVLLVLADLEAVT